MYYQRDSILDLSVEGLVIDDYLYHEDPEAFAVDICGVIMWDKLAEFLWAIAKNQKTVCRGCYASGKTYGLAIACLWFLCTRPYSRVVTTAPTERQVQDLVWTEIAKIHETSPVYIGGEMKKMRLDLAIGWFGRGMPANEYNESSFAGYHAGDVFLGVDESIGIPANVFDAHERFIIGEDDRFAAIANPLDPATRFGQACKDPTFKRVKISAYDIPNVKEDREVIRGLVTRKWVTDKEKRWRSDSPAFQAKVLAEFPESATDNLISLRSVETSNDVWKILNEEYELGKYKPKGKKLLGVDVARSLQGDASALVWRQGRFVPKTRKIRTDNLSRLTAIVEVECKKGWIPCIDIVGLGAGVYDELRDRGYTCIPCSGGSRSQKTDAHGHMGFTNKRTEWYWATAEWLNYNNPEQGALPESDDLLQDLTILKWKEATGGKVQITTKEQVCKLLNRSPDEGDSFAMTFEGESAMTDVDRIAISQPESETIYEMEGDY